MREICKKNAANKAKQTNLHTCGPKSFAVIRERLTRMEELQSQQNGKSGEDAESSCSVDPFLAVIGKEHNGRVRLHGRGVNPSSLGKASIGNWSSSINVPNELLESIKVDVIALSDLLSDCEYDATVTNSGGTTSLFVGVISFEENQPTYRH
ncbi:hypothetical protein Dimus_018686 [Dionaea muscipula]